MKRLAKHWVWSILGLSLLCVIGLYTSFALEQTDATLETIIEGVKSSKSLIEDLVVKYTIENSSDKDFQSYRYKALSESLGTEVEPPPLHTVSEHISKYKGEKVYHAERRVYPRPVPPMPDEIEGAFDGEKVTYIHHYGEK